MKFWGYYSLIAFGVTFAASLLTFAVTRYPPEYGEVVAAVLIVFMLLSLIPAVLSKFVGFGDAAIPKERRGLRAALASLSIPLRIVLVVGVAYAVVILTTTKYNPVRKVLNSYYLEVPLEPGEKPARIYTSQDQEPVKRVLITQDVAYRYKWQWVRIYTAVAAAICVGCGTFFLSRVARQSPELVEMLSQGMFPAQVDDSMNL